MTTAALPSTQARTLRRSLAIAVGALALVFGGAAQAAPGGWHGGGGGWHGGSGGWHGGGHGYYRGGWGWDPLWGVGLGLGLGLAATSPYYYYDDGPGVVYVSPPVYYPPAPVYLQAPPVQSAPAQPSAADPIFYPRNNQSAAQTEADRQECNRWATTQPRAMADASVFQRATLACMDGRGYTAR